MLDHALGPGTAHKGNAPVEQILITGNGPEELTVPGQVHPSQRAATAAFGYPEADSVCCGIPRLIVGKASGEVGIAVFQNGLQADHGGTVIVIPAAVLSVAGVIWGVHRGLQAVGHLSRLIDSVLRGHNTCPDALTGKGLKV